MYSNVFLKLYLQAEVRYQQVYNNGLPNPA